jgi:hypothetical protein
VLSLRLACLALVVGVATASAASPQRRSHSLGLPWDGALVGGVQLPAAGRHFFTWDPVLRRKPNRGWRRFGSVRLVHVLLAVVRQYARAHPQAPRVGVGDLSRPRGGDFGVRYGWPGHASHQNGLDVDVYYPRRDRLERPPDSPAEIDRRLAQDLVTRFVRAGAQLVFVGPHAGLRGPPRVVRVLALHDNHLHVRIRRPRATSLMLGRSELGRPIRAAEVGNPAGTRVLVVGCIHGTECAGRAVVRVLERSPEPRHTDLWLLDNLNPDGFALGVRQNGRGVDLNRNFPAEWRGSSRRWDPEYTGPRPLSERETRIARSLVLRGRPTISLWFHQPQAVVRAWGRSVPAARRYALLAGARFRRIRWPSGTASNWQNHRFPGTSSFVVELPPGRLSRAAAARYARAVLALAD